MTVHRRKQVMAGLLIRVAIPALYAVFSSTNSFGADGKLAPTEANFARALEARLGKQQRCIESSLFVLDLKGTFDAARPDPKAEWFINNDGAQVKGPALQAMGFIKEFKMNKFLPVSPVTLTEKGRSSGTLKEGTFNGGRAWFVDYCYGTPKLTKIVKWEGPGTVGPAQVVNVYYEYSVMNVPDWAKQSAMQKAFPDLAKDQGTTTATDHAMLRLSTAGWE
jgi:hypothetical protein